MEYDDRNLLLCLACDLTPDGQNLGPKTLARLHAAFIHAKHTGDVIVVAAGMSPDFPTQPATMAAMMAAELALWGHDDTIVEHAATFNTRGELAAFMAIKMSGRRTICSATYHLKRTQVIFAKMYGRAATKEIVWLVAPGDKLVTLRERGLEALKWVHVYLPTSVRNRAVASYRLLFGNPSF